MFKYEDLYIHVVFGEIAHKWLIAKAIYTPNLDGRITRAWYDNDTTLMLTERSLVPGLTYNASGSIVCVRSFGKPRGLSVQAF